MDGNRLAVAGAMVLTGGALLAPSPVQACGGCFAPTGQPSVVRAHRMALLVSEPQTTLWDQFEYVGEPEDFVWVLPVSGTQDVQVELSDDAFFQSLVQGTQINLQAPVMGSGGGGGGGLGCASRGDGASFAPAGGEMSNPVTVYHQEVVGPYETVVLGSESGSGLIDWLQEREYAVPDELLPTIDHYVAQGSNFLVLRLAPGEGVRRMQPVRVTVPGENRALPLRMIAAGVGDEVSLELFVFADRRIETDNFTNVTIDAEELTYNSTTRQFNYDVVAERALETDGGRAWLTEYARPAPLSARSTVVYDDDGTRHEAAPEWDFVLEVLDEPYLTRMRARLPVDALEEDLVLRPSLDGDLPTSFFVDNVVTGTGDEEGASGLVVPPPSVAAFALALVGLAMRRSLRRRR